jgi:hypothetical protein
MPPQRRNDTGRDRLEHLGDNCTVKMRSQAGLVVSPACERRQPSAPRVTGKPGDLKDDLASGVCATVTMGLQTKRDSPLLEGPFGPRQGPAEPCRALPGPGRALPMAGLGRAWEGHFGPGQGPAEPCRALPSPTRAWEGPALR